MKNIRLIDPSDKSFSFSGLDCFLPPFQGKSYWSRFYYRPGNKRLQNTRDEFVLLIDEVLNEL